LCPVHNFFIYQEILIKRCTNIHNNKTMYHEQTRTPTNKILQGQSHTCRSNLSMVSYIIYFVSGPSFIVQGILKLLGTNVQKGLTCHTQHPGPYLEGQGHTWSHMVCYMVYFVSDLKRINQRILKSLGTNVKKK
jgi:hypothetical protein